MSAWLNTATGRRFNFLDPKPDDIDIVDIAVALSHQCRYAGHTRWHYSVASHSIVIARTLDAQGFDSDVIAWGLLHDAAEAYVTDIPGPLRAAGLVPELERVEKTIMAAVVSKFDLADTEPQIVTELDLEILDVEADKLLTRNHDWPPGTPREPRPALVREFNRFFFVEGPSTRPSLVARAFLRVAYHLGLASAGDVERLEVGDR